MVAQSDLGSWKETLAILSTYAKSDELLACHTLGARLEEERSDMPSATCAICAVGTPQRRSVSG